MDFTIKQKILELLQPRLEDLGLSKSEVLVTESLLEQGILDSMSFLEFFVDIESEFNIELDLSELDPSEFSSIENIVNLLKNGTTF